MKIVYYSKYQSKKSHRKYGNLKEELNRVEKKISSANSIKDLTFYQDISNSRKIVRFGESKGGYRLALYFYENFCLFVDFEIKQNLERDNNTSEILFNDKSNEYYNSYILKHKEEIKVEKLDLEEYSELLDFIEDDRKDEIILESQNFFNYLSKNSLSEVFGHFNTTLLDYENNKTYKDYKTVYRLSDELFYKLYIDDAIFLYLFTNKDDIEKIESITTKDDLLKNSIKSYPLDILLEGEEEWIEYIVKNNDGNIALSPEEENILLELKSYNSEKYPFFINGRAGSGKSTILQYLFASYLIKFLELKSANQKLEYEPLYLTYNDRLKDKAIDRVTSIILAKTPSDIKERLNLKERKVIYRQIEEYFKSFDVRDGYSFLEELLYLNGKDNPLKDYKKLTYEDIKDYFENLINKKGKKFKNFSPELIWYVIRSFIKGRGVIKSETLQELTLIDYEKLPENLKTISNNTYKTIYNEFYKTYKNYLKREKCYDDLDLVFEVYKQNAFEKKYSIIFCDESQDFTKIEFDLILNLNIFLQDNIKISNFTPKKIPIVFAGDPFQTINPTGFSFKYLKALVYESYQNKGFKDISLNDKELKFNYRSNEEIIKFSNLIQVLRGVIFNNEIEIQKKWLEKNESNSVLLFDKIKKEDYYWFIFPTNDKDEYLDDNLLSSLDIEYLNTPIDVKGLEENVVVLYRFGDFYLKNYEDIEKFIESGFKNREESLKYEYFFNIFYVAITRAKRRLIIVDSDEAKEKFWNKIDIKKLFNKLKQQNKKVDIDELFTFKEGKEEDLKETDENKLIYTSEKLKTDIFERYEDSKDINKKLIILNDIKKIINNQNRLNSIYKDILKGVESEINDKYLLAVEHLMVAAMEAKVNKELSNEQISLLIRKSFDNLYKSILDENHRSLELLNLYKKEFIDIGIKYERRVVLLEKFLNKNYIETLEYIKDEFDRRDFNYILEFIIDKSLSSLDDYELIDILKDFKNRNLIDNKKIVDVVRGRFDESSNCEILIRVFDDNLKDEYKELYCKIKLEIDKDDVECLVYNNKLERVLELISKKDINIDSYYKHLLHFISKKDNFELFNKLSLELIIENYLRFYDELDIKVWRYIIETIFKMEDKDKRNDYISKTMKFFEDKPKRVKEEHTQIIIDTLKENNQVLLNKTLFNTLITIFSEISFDICNVIYSLEHTYSFYDDDNIKKILGFYRYYLGDRKNHFKGIVGSRYIKIMYEYSEYERDKFEIYKKGEDDTFLEYIKRKVKFLRVEADESIINQIPSRLNFDLCKKTYNLKSVDDVYSVIIKEFKKSRDKVAKEIIEANESRLANKGIKIENRIDTIDEDIIKEDKSVIKESDRDMNINTLLQNRDIYDILDEIYDFIEENRDKLDIKKLKKNINQLKGLLND